MPKDMLLQACVRATLFKEQLRQKLIKGVSVALVSSPLTAFAAGGDIADMGASMADGAKSGMGSVLTIAQFAGVCFVVGGLIAAKTKKDNPQIKASHIMGSILFGVCLVVVPEIIKRAQTQVGLTPVNVG
jgi:hypothetical protein